MTTMRALGLASVFVCAVVVTGCSSSDSSSGGGGGGGGGGGSSGCTMTLRGAVTSDSTDCFGIAAFSGKGSVLFNSQLGTSAPEIESAGAVAQFEGEPAAGTTYSKANAFHTSANLKMKDGSQYAATYWAKGPTYPDIPEVGTVAVTLTSVTAKGGATVARGTVEATLVKVKPDGTYDETAKVTLKGTF